MAAPEQKTAQEWVFKEVAAKMLGITPPMVARRAKQGLIRFQYLERAVNERQARVVYFREDIEKLLRGEIPRSPVVVDAVTKQKPVIEMVAHRSTHSASQVEMLQAITTPLLVFAEKYMHSFGPPPYKQAWLTFAEAIAHSGLPGPYLADQLQSGRIMSIGRGPKTWRVSRASLDAFDGLEAAS